MESDSVRVLLVTETASDASYLVTYLRNLGCVCVVSRSVKEACALLDKEQFDLVLSKIVPPGDDCHELPVLLMGRDVSLFYFYAVEGGCWWVPRICHGQECQDEAALRPGEFVRVLTDMITAVRTLPRLARVH